MKKENKNSAIALPTGKEHISFSELKDHVECSFRHNLKHVDKIDMFEENVNTNFGKALHDACENYLETRKMRYEIALDFIREKWQEFDLPNMGQFMNESNILLEAVPGFLDDCFPGWECFSAEEDLMEELPKPHEDVNFKGFVDAVIKHDGKYWILDWKSSNKGWNDWKKKDDNLKMQLILYAKFWGEKHGIPISDINVGFAILNRDLDNSQRIELFSFPIEEKDTNKSLKVLNNSVSLIKKNIKFKRWKYQEPRKQRFCRFCDYNGTKYCP